MALRNVASLTRLNCRALSTIPQARKASDTYFDSTLDTSASSSPDLSEEHRACIDRAIRVDQAGEVAANWIYKGQMAVLGHHREAGPVIQVLSICSFPLTIDSQLNVEGYVGPGKETPGCHE